MAALEVFLLGGFQVRMAGREIGLFGRKERGLLAVLAMAPGKPQSRDKLIGLLWSDREDKRARDSLKHAVLKLRSSLNGTHPPLIVADRDSVTLKQAAVSVDVAEFERLIAEGTMEAFSCASSIYQGDLLDGLDIRDPAFEEWLVIERHRLHDVACEALARLLDHQLATRPRDGAVATARRLVALDPLREAAHRALMGVYAGQGQTALALKQYRSCRDLLQSQLGVKPEIETERLYESILRRRWNGRFESAAIASLPGVAQVPSTVGEARLRDVGSLVHSTKTLIAVQPFKELTCGPELSLFTDGITEDIVTELSRFRGASVIAHQSSPAGNPTVDPVVRARASGAQYVVHGSVRSMPEHVRISARLFDARDGRQLWAEHYDREVKDVFGEQDNVTQMIVGALMRRVEEAQTERAKHKRLDELTPYDCLLRAIELHNRRTEEDEASARDLLRRAIELDPGFALPYAWLSTSLMVDWFEKGSNPAFSEAFDLARRAVELGDREGRCHGNLGYDLLHRRRFADAAVHVERSVALNPNDFMPVFGMGLLLAYAGKPSKAREWCGRVIRLNPDAPEILREGIVVTLYRQRRYAEAAAILKRLVKRQLWDSVYLIASYAQSDLMDEARVAAAEGQVNYPAMSPFSLAKNEPYEEADDRAHLLAGLRKAGVAE
jgi:DNA-binding SARP family transcriptional activator/TolB-like protein/Tfp pilus assembly protein PilF